MSKKKSKRKEIDKRRAKAKQKKLKKQKPKAAKSTNMPDFMFSERPLLSDFAAPEGFYAISMSQALMKYAEPLLELADEDNPKSLDGAMNMAMLFWNYQIALERGEQGDSRIKADLLNVVRKALGTNSTEAEAFIQHMVERKNYLFPPEIQPKASMMMFMRKEVSRLIAAFDYNKLDLYSAPIPADRKDRKMVALLDQMDQYIISGAEYEIYEDHYLKMEKKCAERFKNWLLEKGMTEYSCDFPFYLNTYLNFIYRYIHDDLVTLKSVSPIYFEEFLFDHILRKVMVEPQEYTCWPPAMKLFYRFLYEKNYLDDPEPIINQINKIEPHFIEILRERFG